MRRRVWSVFILAVMLLVLSSCLKVRLVVDEETLETPMPVALVGQTVTKQPNEAGELVAVALTEHNPQLAPAPRAENYEAKSGFSWGAIGKIAANAASGNWGGVLLGGISLLGGGLAAQQRARRKREVAEARAERDRVAQMAPEQAAPEIAAMHLKEKA